MRGRSLLLICAAALGAGVVGLALGFVAYLGQIDQQAPAAVKRAEGMIVLTGGAERVTDAVELFSRGYADRLLITGVNQGISRAEIARLNPKYRELIECCVDLGYEALNTIGNALEAKRWTQRNGISRSLIVVTSNYHLPRAMAEVRHVLPDHELTAYPVVTLKMRNANWWRSPYAVRLLGTEYLKYVLALARLKLIRAAAWGEA